MQRLIKLMVILAMLLPCGYAAGQFQVNTQVSSGGATPLPYARIGTSLGNDIVTGNTTGLSYFHGAVGYGSPRSFRGELRTDDLYRFNATSYPTPGGLGRSGQGYYSPLSVGRSSDAMTGWQVSAYNRAQREGRGSGMVSPLQIRRNAYTAAAITSRRTDDDDSTLGLLRTGDGRAVEFKASPLLGVTQTLRPVSGDWKWEELQVPTEEGEEGMETPVKPTEPAITPEQVAMELGLQLQTSQMAALMEDQQEGEKPAVDDKAMQQRAAELEQALFSKLDEPRVPEEGEDAYIDLLAMIKQQAGEERKAAVDNQIQELADSLKSPSNEQLQQAHLERENAVRRMLGLPEVEGRQPSDEQMAAEGGESKQAIKALHSGMDELVDMLNYDLPRLETLAGNQPLPTNQWMRDGEQALAEGDYFEAESSFRRVLISRPDYPLARVGLIHAQLGAGLIRTATFNLRRLFEQYPQLIATRYEARLLPTSDRLVWLNGQLERMIVRTESRQDPALALAYLGYQTGSMPNVAYGLDMAEARRPDDTLIPLLRSIWLDNPGEAEKIEP